MKFKYLRQVGGDDPQIKSHLQKDLSLKSISSSEAF